MSGQHARTAAILAGAPFPYAVVGYGDNAAEALAWAQHWQRVNGSAGPGSALYGRTVPVAWGEPEPVAWHPGQWRVPVQWAVAAHAAAVYG